MKDKDANSKRKNSNYKKIKPSFNTENIDLNNLSELKKIMGVAEDNDDYIYIEGVGIIWETGKLDLEGLVKELLKSKYITG